jgi:cytoplasmic iron level regulating protein YaaA (DUF328/UPF0246 family)
MKILISPAKSINENAIKTSDSTIPIFQKEAQQIVKNLRKLSTEDLKKLMSISDELAVLNRNRYKNWKKSDEIRDKINELGWKVEDLDGKQKITKR